VPVREAFPELGFIVRVRRCFPDPDEGTRVPMLDGEKVACHSQLSTRKVEIKQSSTPPEAEKRGWQIRR
jgi:hypothetical protein